MEAYLHSILNHVDDVIWLFSLENQKYLYISPSVYTLRGYTPEEAMQEGLHDSMEEEDYHFIVNHLNPRIQHFENGENSFGSMKHEIRQICKDSSRKWVEVSTTLIKNKHGKVVEIAGVSRDISIRKKQEQLLQDTRKFLETTFNITSTGIALLDDEGIIVNVNRGFGKMLGYPIEYMLGKCFFDFIVAGDKDCVKELFELTLQQRDLEKQSEIRMVNLRNQVIWGLITLSGVKVTHNKNTHWVIQLQETTERKKSDEIIRLLNTDLQHKHKEMEQLIYVTSHDLRSPLVNIKGFGKELEYSYHEALQILKEAANEAQLSDKLAPIEKDIQESFSYIDISIEKMDKLLGGLLHYSRLGKKMPHPSDINMNDLLANVVKNFEYTIKSKGCKVEVSPLANCRAREEMINRAFSNLLGNALKYLDPNKAGHIKITSELHHDYAVFCVEDNGIGIDSQYHHKVFELFCRLNPQMGEGEGLGLSTVKKILELNYGKITMESEPGKGSRFYVWLPLPEGKKEKAAKNN